MIAAKSQAIMMGASMLKSALPALSASMPRWMASAASDSVPIKVLGITGSLRKQSINTGMLNAAARRLPAGTTMEMADVASLPMYNDDLWQGKEDDSALPAPIRKLRAQVSEADVILFSCPEYNHSLSPVLKNALDWGSKRPCVFADKVACVLGAGGGAGTARAQMHFQNVAACLQLDIPAFPAGSLQVNAFAPNAGIDFATGQITSKAVEDQIANVVASTIEHARATKIKAAK